MSLYARLIRRWSHTGWFTWWVSRLADPLDRLVHRLTRGRRLATPAEIPTVLLTTTGRRSGEPRPVPLIIVAVDGDEFVAATNFGRPHHPGWALNLLARPEAIADDGDERWTVRAVPVSPAARDRLWPAFDSVFPGYRRYRERAGRDVHMFKLERA
jgi:deazaflavin-dependent oxidoreductase (nitroreductase family)